MACKLDMTFITGLEHISNMQAVWPECSLTKTAGFRQRNKTFSEKSSEETLKRDCRGFLKANDHEKA